MRRDRRRVVQFFSFGHSCAPVRGLDSDATVGRGCCGARSGVAGARRAEDIPVARGHLLARPVVHVPRNEVGVVANLPLQDVVDVVAGLGLRKATHGGHQPRLVNLGQSMNTED